MFYVVPSSLTKPKLSHVYFFKKGCFNKVPTNFCYKQHTFVNETDKLNIAVFSKFHYTNYPRFEKFSQIRESHILHHSKKKPLFDEVLHKFAKWYLKFVNITSVPTRKEETPCIIMDETLSLYVLVGP